MHRVGISLAGLAIAGLLGAAAYVAVGSPVAYFLFEHGCRAEEESLGEALAAESVLDAPPEGAGERESYQECDDDDLFVVAGKSYAYGGSRNGALAHYRDAARAAGWRGHAEDCFTRRIDGTTAYLTVEGPADGTLHVEIIADREGSRWC